MKENKQLYHLTKKKLWVADLVFKRNCFLLLGLIFISRLRPLKISLRLETQPNIPVHNFLVYRIVQFSIAGREMKCFDHGKLVQMDAQWQQALDHLSIPGKQVTILVTMATKGINLKVFEAMTLRHLKILHEQKLLIPFLKYLTNCLKKCDLIQPEHLKNSCFFLVIYNNSNPLIWPAKF